VDQTDGRGPAPTVPTEDPAPPARAGRVAATVEFEHVTKVYGRTEQGTPGAVNDLSLFVPAGKICVLVGPSG